MGLAKVEVKISSWNGTGWDVMTSPEWKDTVAGDDTIFVLLHSGRDGQKVLARIREYTE